MFPKPIIGRQLLSGTNVSLAEEQQTAPDALHPEVRLATMVDELGAIAVHRTVNDPMAVEPREVDIRKPAGPPRLFQEAQCLLPGETLTDVFDHLAVARDWLQGKYATEVDC
jgi:hypothetical protein